MIPGTSRPSLSVFLRSALFMLLLVVFTIPYTLGVICCFALPHRWRQRAVLPWVYVATRMIRHILGIDYRVLGRENIPDRSCVVLCKHQSAWETIILQQVFSRTLFVWKKELKMLPFFGWALAVTPMISVNRSGGKEALRQLVEQGRLRLAQGYTVVIFPEGTRTPIGTHRRYKVGGAHLAVETGVPVVPVALNAGQFWSRRAFIKYPGTVTVSIGAPIDPDGLTADDVSARAEAWMEAEMRRISPQYYPQDESGRTAA